MRLKIEPSLLRGSFKIPPSKSQTLRAILFGMLAHGESLIENVLPSPDTRAMIEAARGFGAKITLEGDKLRIIGGDLKAPDQVIDCGNSGLTLRLIAGVSSLISSYTVLTGDFSIRSNRPMAPLLDALEQLGAFAVSSRGNGLAPFIIRGPLTKGEAVFEGKDSQFVSSLAIVSAFAPHPIRFKVVNPGERPWIDLTLSWLSRFKIPYRMKNYEEYEFQGGAHLRGFHYAVPGDLSSAAFPIAAAIVTGSEIELQNIDLTDLQGDKKLIFILQEMGANLEVDADLKSLKVKKGGKLKGKKIDVNDFIDALPILSVIGCFAEGRTEIIGAEIARKKESDRIFAMAKELQKMGAKIEEREGGLIIEGSKLKGATLSGHLDHRVAMSLAVAAMGALGTTHLEGAEWMQKTYPRFVEDFQIAGANIWREDGL